jgi:hypothetical protein
MGRTVLTAGVKGGGIKRDIINLLRINESFVYRRGSGFFSALSSATNQLMPEKTRTSPIEKRTIE